MVLLRINKKLEFTLQLFHFYLLCVLDFFSRVCVALVFVWLTWLSGLLCSPVPVGVQIALDPALGVQDLAGIARGIRSTADGSRSLIVGGQG